MKPTDHMNQINQEWNESKERLEAQEDWTGKIRAYEKWLITAYDIWILAEKGNLSDEIFERYIAKNMPMHLYQTPILKREIKEFNRHIVAIKVKIEEGEQITENQKLLKETYTTIVKIMKGELSFYSSNLPI